MKIVPDSRMPRRLPSIRSDDDDDRDQDALGKEPGRSR